MPHTLLGNQLIQMLAFMSIPAISHGNGIERKAAEVAYNASFVLVKENRSLINS